MSEKRHRSFYANALDEAERVELRNAADLEGIDDEIAVLRVRIKKLVRSDDIEELTRCTNALCRMLITRHTVEVKARKGIKEAIGNVLRDILIPLGVNIGSATMIKKL